MSHRALMLLLLWLAALSMLACAQSHRSPTLPSVADEATPLAVFVGPDVITGPLGRYRLQFDGETVEIVPGRSLAATPGQLFHVDLTEALTDTFCHNCLQVEGITRIIDGIQVELSLRHPFALADDSQPPSAGNRRDLWVSTVKAVILNEGNVGHFGDTVFTDKPLLLNPDGYTTLLAPAIGDPNTAHPYCVFGATGANLTAGNFDATSGWGDNADDPQGFLVLANDQTATTSLQFRLAPSESQTVDLVLTAAFSPGATGLTSRLIPDYFMPAGTPPEAWRVTTRVDGELDPFNANSAVNLHIEVLDWQLDPAYAVDGNFPVSGDRTRIPSASGIASIELSLPEITGEAITLLDIADGSGLGTAADPWQLNATLKNNGEAGPGTYIGLLRVIDERDPASTDAPYGSTTFIGPDLTTPYAAPSQFATYALVTASVVGDSDCMEVFEMFHGEADLYIPGEPLYQLVRTQSDLDTLLATLQVDPVDITFDEAFESVIVAVGGWYFNGKGIRDIDITEVCPINNKLHIAVTRTEAVTGCPLPGAPTAPMEIAIIQTRNSSHVFNETLIDWCATGCVDATWAEVGAGDAVAESGYTGPDIDLFCNDQGTYDTAIAQLGLTAPPAIDFVANIGWVICSGAAADPDAARFVEVLGVCQVPGSSLYRVTWQAGEYATCTPVDTSPSAPYVILTLPRNTGGGESTAYVVDICKSAFDCEPQVAPEAMFGDYQLNQELGQQSYYISSAFEYTPAWEDFFFDERNRPAQPNIDFERFDAVLLTSGFSLNGQGWRSIHAPSICLDKTAGILHITEQREELLTCEPKGPPSHPWTLVLVPDGGPYTLDRQVTVLDVCRETTNCETPTLVAEGLISDYFEEAAQYHYFGQVNFPERVAAYEDAWSQLSSDPAPGIADWQPDEAIFLFMYGFRLDDLGGNQVRLDAFCQDTSTQQYVAEITRISAPDDCVMPIIRNSPWRVYKVPLKASTVQIDIALDAICPDP